MKKTTCLAGAASPDIAMPGQSGLVPGATRLF
jgi:hypothetical protein